MLTTLGAISELAETAEFNVRYFSREEAEAIGSCIGTDALFILEFLFLVGVFCNLLVYPHYNFNHRNRNNYKD